jgi:hypothetical protein
MRFTDMTFGKYGGYYWHSEFVETIPYEYLEQFKWEDDIQCWKCNEFLMINPEIKNEQRNGYLIISDLPDKKSNIIKEDSNCFFDMDFGRKHL